MSRLSLLEPDNEPAALKPVFDQLRATRGRVPGMYRTLAHQPDILAAHRAYFHAALDSGVLPRPFKEKIAFKVARLRETPYCIGSHKSYALKHGVSLQELEAIDRGHYTEMPGREQAVLRFTEAMVAASAGVNDAAFTELRLYFAENETVEIVALIGIMELACSFAQVFDLAADR
jgi:4-carboxymuconolactone decarboxylase